MQQVFQPSSKPNRALPHPQVLYFFNLVSFLQVYIDESLQRGKAVPLFHLQSQVLPEQQRYHAYENSQRGPAVQVNIVNIILICNNCSNQIVGMNLRIVSQWWALCERNLCFSVFRPSSVVHIIFTLPHITEKDANTICQAWPKAHQRGICRQIDIEILQELQNCPLKSEL